MDNPIRCRLCEKGDGTVGTIRTFKTQYGYRMHLRKTHSLKERDGKLVHARPRRDGK